MKRYGTELIAVIAILGLPVLSCDRQEEDAIGNEGLTAHIVNVETRTSFDSYVGKFAWSEGDRIVLHMSDGTFFTAEVTPETGAFACPTTAYRSRDFFALYPAGIVDEDNYGDPQLNVTLPSSYDISGNLSSIVAPVPMVAVNREAESDLYFRHVGGLLRVTVNNVPAGTKWLEMSMDGRITGTFMVRDAATDHPSISSFALNSDYGDPVRFQVSESGLAADRNGIILNLPLPTGHYSSATLKALGSDESVLQTQTQSVSFDVVSARGKKMFFGVTDYQFSVTNPNALSYLGGTSTDATVTSSMVDRGVSREVSWYVDGYYADANCTTPYDGTDASNAPAWLTSFNGDGTGEGSVTGEAVTIEYAVAPHAVTSETYSDEAQAKNAVIAASTFGAGSSTLCYYNLSSPAARTSDYITESANCYIVNGTGYFRLPLVLGNGVINDQPNPVTTAWKGRSVSGAVTFVDYKNAIPESPYLHESSANVGVPTSAFVVWEDVDGLIEVADEKKFILADTPVTRRSSCYWLNFHVAKAEQGNAVIAVTDASGTVMWSWHIWVTDYVPRNYGGNNEISVATEDPAYRYDVMPINLGWVVCGIVRKISYEPDVVYVQLVQEGSGNKSAVPLQRYAKTVTLTYEPYTNPYYQWGRKDALYPYERYQDVFSCYGRYPDPTLYLKSEMISLQETILHPQSYVFYDGNWRNGWFYSATQVRSNLWGSYGTTIDYSPLQKTIYDPCPPGYSIPPSGTFTGFTPQGVQLCDYAEANIYDLNGDGYITIDDYEDGWYFYTDDTKTSTIFFPAMSPIERGVDNALRAPYYKNMGIYHTSGSYAGYSCTVSFSLEKGGRVYGYGYSSTGSGKSIRPIATQTVPGVSSNGVSGHRYDLGSETWQ